SGDEALGALENAVQHALRAAHLPQHVDVDRALARSDFVGALHLRDRAVDRVSDELLVPIASGQCLIDLRNDPTFGVIAVGVDRRDGADAPRGRPGARARMVGGRNALAAFDQRPDLASAIENGLKPLEQTLSPDLPRAI